MPQDPASRGLIPLTKSEPHTCRSSLVGSMGSIMKREIIVLGDLAYIPLSNGQFATIDAVDVPLVEGYNWTAAVRKHTTYVERNSVTGGVRKIVLLHRVIAGTPDGMFTDHINGDGLDNRRCNLRVVDKVQNGRNQKVTERNTSGFKGVTWDSQRGKWRSQIVVDHKQRYLGLYLNPEDAHAAYAKASAELHGEFGRLM
jgi:hypothetical protein